MIPLAKLPNQGCETRPMAVAPLYESSTVRVAGAVGPKAAAAEIMEVTNFTVSFVPVTSNVSPGARS